MSRTSHVTTVDQHAHNLGLIVRELGVRATITYLRFRAAERAGGAAAPMWLRSRQTRHPLLCRSRSSDLAYFGQIFLEQEFRRAMKGLSDARFIVDCGANVGVVLHRNLKAYGGRALR